MKSLSLAVILFLGIGINSVFTETCWAQKKIASSSGDNPPAHTLDPAITVGRSSLERISALKDYQAVFTKQEQVGGQMIRHEMKVKIRHRPFSVYMHFSGREEGREVIYVEGRNDGNLLVHETGLTSLIGTIKLDPNGRQAMSESRHPITKMGMQRMLEILLQQWQSEKKYDDIQLKYFPKAKLGDRLCKVIQTSHRKRKKSVEFQMTRLFIDRESSLPVRIEQYAYPEKAGSEPVLVEEYTYSNVQSNTGLKDIDFDSENPEYDF